MTFCARLDLKPLLYCRRFQEVARRKDAALGSGHASIPDIASGYSHGRAYAVDLGVINRDPSLIRRTAITNHHSMRLPNWPT